MRGRELRVRLGLGRLRAEELARELARGDHAFAVRMDELRVEAAARRCPAVVHVVAARRDRGGACSTRSRSTPTMSSVRSSDVGWSAMRISSVPKRRMRTEIPPDARVIGHHADRHEPLDPRLPVGDSESNAGGGPRAAAPRARRRGSRACRWLARRRTASSPRARARPAARRAPPRTARSSAPRSRRRRARAARSRPAARAG